MLLLVWDPRLKEHVDPKTGATLSALRKAARAYGYEWKANPLPSERSPHLWFSITHRKGEKR